MAIVTLAVASLVVAAGAAYMQNKNQRAALREQKRANATAQAENAASRAVAIRDQFRQSRVRTAQIIQASANTGTMGSSGQIGGGSAVGSLVGANVASLARAGNSQAAIQENNVAASGYNAQAATWGSVGNLASTSFNLFASTDEFKGTMNKLFS